MLDNMQRLLNLLNYEIRCAKRYRRFVSLVLMAPAAGSEHFQDIIQECKVRECDEIFTLHDESAILLGETDNTGAIVALERCQEYTNGTYDIRSSVVSFPFDGHTADELLEIAKRRLEKAKTMTVVGAVITTG